MPTIAYVYSYYGRHDTEKRPPISLEGAVERILPMLNPTRTNVLTCGTVLPHQLVFGPLRTNPGWIVTITPTEDEAPADA